MAALTVNRPAPRGGTPTNPASLQTWIVRVIIYIVLGGVAFLMLFPFLYMAFTSLKTTNDVFHSPPRLLPYSSITTEIDGVLAETFTLPINGVETRTRLDDEAGTVRFGFFTTSENINANTPRESVITAQMPLEEARETGETQTIGGRDFDVYEVDTEAGTERLLLAYPGGLLRYVSLDDPSMFTYAARSAAQPEEQVLFNWGNYQSVLTLRNLDRALVNTTLVTVLVTAGQVITSLLGGYAFSRIRFAGRNGLFGLYLATIMIPFVVLIIPLYQLMVILGWQNRLVALILPWIFTAYGTFLMRQFFITIPKDLEEAALLDGLGRLGILLRIFIPLSGPAIATQTIITFLYAWNSFVWPLVIINEGNTANHVITLSLIQLRNAAAAEPNLVLTGAAISVLPPLIVFTLAQRYFIEGIASSGLK